MLARIDAALFGRPGSGANRDVKAKALLLGRTSASQFSSFMDFLLHGLRAIHARRVGASSQGSVLETAQAAGNKGSLEAAGGVVVRAPAPSTLGARLVDGVLPRVFAVRGEAGAESHVVDDALDTDLLLMTAGSLSSLVSGLLVLLYDGPPQRLSISALSASSESSPGFACRASANTCLATIGEPPFQSAFAKSSQPFG